MTQARLLAVHAHADDETITMGGTLALYADRGALVANVCCTDGELASIVAPDMPEDTTRPRLGAIRREELRAACAILGVTDVRFLGQHDSGMAGEASNRRPEAFWMQPMDDMVGALVAILREVRPHVVMTYDAYGGYGHPDHVQAHRVTLLAVEAAAHRALFRDSGEPWAVSKLYYTAFPRSGARRVIEMVLAAGLPHPFWGKSADELEMAVDDALITASIDVRSTFGRKEDALRAHRSQIDESFPLLSAPREAREQLMAHEHYRLCLSRVPVSPPENDLLAGIDLAD